MIWVVLVALIVVLIGFAWTVVLHDDTEEIAQKALDTAEAAFDLMLEDHGLPSGEERADVVLFDNPLPITSEFCNNCHGPLDEPILVLDAQVPLPNGGDKDFRFKLCERCTSGS